MLFIEESTPPPFYQETLTPEKRTQLDKWFIGNRSQAYYLQRFAEFDAQGYLSAKWHWAAFFATFGWLLYRKRYLDSIVYTIAGWSFIQLNIVIALVLAEFLFIGRIAVAYQMPLRFSIAAFIWLFWSYMVARWTDAYYYRMARREIADVIANYPDDVAKQQAHLQREGSVSYIGLGFGFALFLLALTIIKVQFLPLYAKPKAAMIIQEVYEVTRIASAQLETRYQQTGQCTQAALTLSTSPYVTLSVPPSVIATGTNHRQRSACRIEARIQGVPFPNRNLNGQTLVMYRPTAGVYSRWHCETSLNHKQKPQGCINEEGQ